MTYIRDLQVTYKTPPPFETLKGCKGTLVSDLQDTYKTHTRHLQVTLKRLTAPFNHLKSAIDSAIDTLGVTRIRDLQVTHSL